ncbi:MAG: TrkH family potassium uptake protein [Hyphomicrobiaceae bacterium]|nr:TrkH family potassium uptake protein [Hyphomicrobiaceae bacterium]MCC0022627.1 TrkH family potassium uptake protein [Hyphomicrobiaceae bacterium]
MGFRTILTIIGALLATLGVTMLIPAMIDALAGNDDWRVFFACSLITTLFGAGLWASSSGHVEPLSLRQAFLLTTLVWIVLTLFSALPFMWSDLHASFTDAVFESISGFTTTGSTVLVGLDNMPPGILMWRAILQWLGGLGIVVMSIAVLPMLSVGGMQMFKAEAFETPDKILPRAANIAGGMVAIYSILTLVCALLYWMSGMSLFDAVAHSMTTLATGGYSTKDASLGAYESHAIEYIAVVFMILGATPFALFLAATAGQVSRLWKDSQLRAFLGLIALGTALAFWMQTSANLHHGEEAFRHAIFSVVSVMTGTGFGNADYNAWGPAPVALFFILTFLGGCTGSTSCGIKVFRFQVLAKDLAQHVSRVLMPSRVYIKRFNGMPLTDDVSRSVQAFVFLYIVCFLIEAVLLGLAGLDPVTALSGAATTISNVGPGLGPIIGPAGNFAPLSDFVKWVMSVSMLVGRLEVLVVLVLLSPRFWRG